MPHLHVSTGTSSESGIAYLNALAGVVGIMNDAAESRIISRHEEHTPNGIVVTIEVVCYSEEDLRENTGLEPEGERMGGKTGAVSRGRGRPMELSDMLYLHSTQEIEHLREIAMEQTIEEMAHPEDHMQPLPPVEAQFDEAAQPSDASYVHRHDTGNAAELGERIMTELVAQEIEDSVRHDVLSAGTVTWLDNEPPQPVPPEESFQKGAKRRKPPMDDLELVA